MHKFLFLFFFIAVFSACSDDDSGVPFFELSCLGDVNPPTVQIDCDNFPLNEQICEANHVGDFDLSENSRGFLSQFCRNIGDVDTYVNANGDEKNMEIIFKNFFQSHSVANTFEPCESDSSKNKGACFGFELGILRMASQTDSLEINIHLKTRLSNSDYSGEKIGDVLEILRKLPNGILLLEFSALVDPRSIGYNSNINQENLGTLELLGKSYAEVISVDVSNSANPDVFKYYYNKRVGLIAFEDSNDVLWRIEE